MYQVCKLAAHGADHHVQLAHRSHQHWPRLPNIAYNRNAQAECQKPRHHLQSMNDTAKTCIATSKLTSWREGAVMAEAVANAIRTKAANFMIG
jgi:hypothetical protein